MSEAKLEILRLVAQGKISPEEARRMLDALDAESGGADASTESGTKRDEAGSADASARDESARGGSRFADGFAQMIEEVGETVRRAVEDAMGAAGRVFEETRADTQTVPVIDGAFVLDRDARLKIQQAIRVSWGGGSKGGNVIARAVPSSDRVRIVRGEAVEVHRVANEYTMTWAKGHLEVEVPQQLSGFEVRCMGGDLEVQEFPGPLWLETMGGELRVQSPRAPFRFRTLGGRVRVAGCSMKDGLSSINTTGGDVVLEIASDASVTVHASSLGGSIEFPPGTDRNVQGKTRKRAACVIGEGTGDLRVNTLGGDIRVRLRT